MKCWVCGGTSFHVGPILWDELCTEWQISPEERAYVDRQQGTYCTSCGNNLRAICLAKAVLDVRTASGTLVDWVGTADAAGLRILELNEAGDLTKVLARLPGHLLARYPDVDMRALPYPAAMFDLVIHSDSLEHVPHPIRALSECRRVLKPGGILAFTVPTIVGRLTRDRSGLPLSFHGNREISSPDFAVATEYGADMWTHVVRAGFDAVAIHALNFPDALAMTARA